MIRTMYEKTMFLVQMVALGGLSMMLVLLAFHPAVGYTMQVHAGMGAFVGLVAFAKLIQDEMQLRREIKEMESV